jgi:hypothetical protein
MLLFMRLNPIVARRIVRALAVLGFLLPTGRVWSDDPAPVAPSKPPMATVRLLDAGAEPRAALRLRVPKGQKEKGTSTLTAQRVVVPAAVPDVTTVVVTVEAKEAKRASTVAYDMLLEAMTMEGSAAPGSSVRKALDAALASLKGATASVTVSDRGQVTDRIFQDPEDVLSFVEGAFEKAIVEMRDLGVPTLPEEPVGVGGRWEVTAPFATNGMILESVVVYTLKARDKDRLDLDLAITMRGTPQPLPIPQRTRITKLELVTATGTGSGQITFDLPRLVPTKGRTKLSTKGTLKVTLGTAVTDQAVETVTEVAMTGEVLPAAAPGK